MCMFITLYFLLFVCQSNGLVSSSGLADVSNCKSSTVLTTSSYSSSVSSKPVTAVMTVSGGGKHALRQQARRRRRNTSIAAGNSPPITRITMKSHSQQQQLHSSPTPPNVPSNAGANAITMSPHQYSSHTTSIVMQPSLSPLVTTPQSSPHSILPLSPLASHTPLSPHSPSISCPHSPIHCSSASVVTNRPFSILTTSTQVSSMNTNAISTNLSPSYISEPTSCQSLTFSTRNTRPGQNRAAIHNLDPFHSSIGTDLSSIVNSAISSVVTISARNNSNNNNNNTSTCNTRITNSIPSRTLTNANNALRNLAANSKSITLAANRSSLLSSGRSNKAMLNLNNKNLALAKLCTRNASQQVIPVTVSVAVSTVSSDSVLLCQQKSNNTISSLTRTSRAAQRSSSRLAWSSSGNVTSSSNTITNNSSGSTTQSVSLGPTTTSIICVSTPTTSHASLASVTSPLATSTSLAATLQQQPAQSSAVNNSKLNYCLYYITVCIII